MKKLVFTIQVLVILAMFPVYVTLELNHGLPENKNHTVVKESGEINIIHVSLNSEVQNENSIPGKMLTSSTASVARLK